MALMFTFLACSQLIAALRRQPVPAERHECPLQQHRHPAACAATPPAARPLRAALPSAQLPVWQPGLLQLLHHEELLFRWWQRSGWSSHHANTEPKLLQIRKKKRHVCKLQGCTKSKQASRKKNKASRSLRHRFQTPVRGVQIRLPLKSMKYVCMKRYTGNLKVSTSCAAIKEISSI